MLTRLSLNRRSWIVSLVSAGATLLVRGTTAQEPAAAVDLSGCWEGCWYSHCKRHKGKLRATLCRCGDSAYRADFSGTFFKILPFRYSVTLHAEPPEDGGVNLSGSQYLGRLFGTFHFTGHATDSDFNATYTSCKDRGAFCMRRVCG